MKFDFSYHVDDCPCHSCEYARHVADQGIKQAMEAADREYDRRNIPVLRPIANRPLIPPTYTAAGGKQLGEWVRENCSKLYDWFNATMDYSDEAETWGTFCAEQFYQQQGRDMSVREWMS